MSGIAPFRLRVAVRLFYWARNHRLNGGPFRWPSAAIYRTYALIGLGIDIPTSTNIGPGLTIHHGTGLVVHNGSVIGSNVTLRQTTTIGSKSVGGKAPILEDDVDVGSNVVILGEVRVGTGSRIGAGAVVVRDVKSGTTVAGNPAREIIDKSLGRET